MSHELRTQLNAILGFSRVLARERDATTDQREKLAIIERIEPLAPDTAKGLRTLLGDFQIGLIHDLLGDNYEQ